MKKIKIERAYLPEGTYGDLSIDGEYFVTLVNGLHVEAPQPVDQRYETSDNCLYCHQPDERK